MTLPIAAATMARAAEPSRIVFHHPGESGQPGGQAQAFEAGANLVHSFTDEADGVTAADVVGFFMALLSFEDSTP